MLKITSSAVTLFTFTELFEAIETIEVIEVVEKKASA